MSGFWKFTSNYASRVTKILESDDILLEDLLDEKETVSELLASNSRLIEYLRRPEVLENLIDYVVEDDEYQRKEIQMDLDSRKSLENDDDDDNNNEDEDNNNIDNNNNNNNNNNNIDNNNNNNIDNNNNNSNISIKDENEKEKENQLKTNITENINIDSKNHNSINMEIPNDDKINQLNNDDEDSD
ncbi:hypothetical protein C6P40_004862, partial [Pichia californica]